MTYFKSSNILLGENYHTKLSYSALTKLGPSGGMTCVSTRVIGTYGYTTNAWTGQEVLSSSLWSQWESRSSASQEWGNISKGEQRFVHGGTRAKRLLDTQKTSEVGDPSPLAETNSQRG